MISCCVGLCAGWGKPDVSVVIDPLLKVATLRSIILAFVCLLTTGALVTTGAAPRARGRVAVPDSIATRRDLERVSELFLIAARDAWVESAVPVTSARPLANVHCHFDGSFSGGREGRRNSLGTPTGILTSEFSRFSICPDWQSSERRGAIDESQDPDVALLPPWPSRISASRESLLNKFDSAAALFPHDEWITGQRVRFRLDAGQLERARSVVASCTADTLWCALLLGYVTYASGNVREADSTFMRALAAVPDSVRCAYGSVQPLLPRDTRARYEQLSCFARDSINRAAYWLGDPMWSEPGNERRAEQFAREVRAQLTFALPRNERWDLRHTNGGDAIYQMFLRYGWPSATLYGGLQQDQGHDGWLGSYATPPYSAPEYTRDRIATLPSYDAMRDPMTIQDNDFVLTAPRGDVLSWWPTEHFRRKRGTVTTFAQGQTALLRRDGNVLLAVATTLSAARLESHYGRPVTAALVVSPSPDVASTLTTRSAAFGDRVLLRARVARGRTLAGVEVQSTRGTPIAARSRFGLVAPAALTDMSPRETAVSEPVLFDPQGIDALGQVEMADPFDFIYYGLQFSKPQRLGVFWESYGFVPGDSVQVTVRLERVTPVGRLRRIGVAMRVAADPNGAVTASWTEPQPGRSATRIVGSIPVLARHITLDVRTLQSGTWRLRVSMQRPREREVFADRLFEVRR